MDIKGLSGIWAD